MHGSEIQTIEDNLSPLRSYILTQLEEIRTSLLTGNGPRTQDLSIGPGYPPIYPSTQRQGNIIGIHSRPTPSAMDESEVGFFLHMDQFLTLVSHLDFQEFIAHCKESSFYIGFDAQWNMFSEMMGADTMLAASKPGNSLLDRDGMGMLSTRHLQICISRSFTQEEQDAEKQEMIEVFGITPDNPPNDQE